MGVAGEEGERELPERPPEEQAEDGAQRGDVQKRIEERPEEAERRALVEHGEPAAHQVGERETVAPELRDVGAEPQQPGSRSDEHAPPVVAAGVVIVSGECRRHVRLKDSEHVGDRQ